MSPTHDSVKEEFLALLKRDLEVTGDLPESTQKQVLEYARTLEVKRRRGTKNERRS